MHILIDTITMIIIIFSIWSGWRKGLTLSALNVLRIIISAVLAYFAGRYLGSWLGEALHRPRIIMIPLLASFTFLSSYFLFHILMSNIHEDRLEKEKAAQFHLPWYQRAGGSLINAAASSVLLILIFWLSELLLIGVSGHGIPGAQKAKWGQISHRGIYECANMILSKEGHEMQSATLATVISNPEQSVENLRNIIEADSIQNLIQDQTFAAALISGDSNEISNNNALKQLFKDRRTWNEMKAIGLFSGRETESDICERLALLGGNEIIQANAENLHSRDLLRTDKLLTLIRTPEFDLIVGELLK